MFRLEATSVLKLPFKIVVQPQRDDWIGPQGLAGLPRFFCTTESPGLFISVLRKYAGRSSFAIAGNAENAENLYQAPASYHFCISAFSALHSMNSFGLTSHRSLG
jgi:hypothetical protein